MNLAMSTDGLLALVTPPRYKFVRIITHESNGIKGWEATISHQGHLYTARRVSFHDALRAAIDKAECGWVKLPRRSGSVGPPPKLVLRRDEP